MNKKQIAEQIAEMCKIAKTIDLFSAAMRDRMKEKLLLGYGGWDDRKKYKDKFIVSGMMQDFAMVIQTTDLEDNVYLDIANRALMLWCRNNKIRSEK